MREGLAHHRQHLVVGELGSADLQGRGTQPVAVAHLHHRNPRPVGGLGIGAELRRVELVSDGVLAVPQRRVVHDHGVRRHHHRPLLLCGG
jgi:hypothetical protein